MVNQPTVKPQPQRAGAGAPRAGTTQARRPPPTTQGGGDADNAKSLKAAVELETNVASDGEEASPVAAKQNASGNVTTDSGVKSGDDAVNVSSSTLESSDMTPRGPRGEEELASRTIHVQSKRFYLDLKQNSRGRFVKIAEVLPDGAKSRVALTLTAAREFRNHLTQFADFYASMGRGTAGQVVRKSSTSSNADTTRGRNPALKSAVIYSNGGAKMPVLGRRRYFLDLKENRRGKFLQVAEASSRAGYITRNQIVVPAQGIVEFRNILSDLLVEFWPMDDSDVGDVDEGDATVLKEKSFPQSKSLRVHQGKVLYFDSGVNPRGSYLRISQVTTRFRTSVLLPKDSLSRVHSLLGDIIKEFDASNSAGVAEGETADKRRAKNASSPKAVTASEE